MSCSYEQWQIEPLLVRLWVTSCSDTFGNEVLFRWTSGENPSLRVSQCLTGYNPDADTCIGDGRDVDITLTHPGPLWPSFPTRLSYLDREWIYDGTTAATLPENTRWQYTLSGNV
jgi:hypothetical protein